MLGRVRAPSKWISHFFLVVLFVCCIPFAVRSNAAGIIPLEWKVQLALEGHSGRVTLTFGTSRYATLAYDANLDTISPPKPPSGLYGAFLIQSFPNYLTADYRPYADSSLVWQLELMSDAGDTLQLSWRIDGLRFSADSLIAMPALVMKYQDQAVDMLHDSSVVIRASSATLEIRYLAPLRIHWSDVRKNDSTGVPVLIGRTIRLSGVVTIGQEFGPWGPTFVQDRSVGKFGLCICDSLVPSQVERDDSVVVEGTLSQSRGMTCLKEAKVLYRFLKAAGVRPRSISLGSLQDRSAEQMEGLLVSISSVRMKDSSEATLLPGAIMTIEDAQGASGLLFVFPHSAVANTAAGGEFDLEGIVVQIDTVSSDGFWQNYAIAPVELVTGIERTQQDGATHPAHFRLFEAYPNPFNGKTRISFELPNPSHTVVRIFDISGRLVRSFDLGTVWPGHNTIRWDGTNAAGVPLPSGIYVCEVKTPYISKKTKLLLLR